MVGFFTLLSFVAALAGGGWFWLGFIVMLGVWSNKAEEEKKKKKPSVVLTKDQVIEFEVKALAGDVLAQYQLGCWYDDITNLKHDPKQAFQWFILAADKGHVASQTFTGWKYEQGEGTARDYEKAREWYRRAATSGNDALAQFNLASMYERGLGGDADQDMALTWYKAAAAEGYFSAVEKLKELSEKHAPSSIPNSSNGWFQQLTDICAQYSANGYYVAELIPSKKLENALKKYPPHGGGRAVALIDTTVFGSADNGMLIGENGLSWSNFLETSTVSSMSWAELHLLAVTLDGTKVKIGNKAIFETTGTNLDKKDIRSLLEWIGNVWSESVDRPAPKHIPSEPETTQPIPTPPVLPPAPEPPKLETTDINSADFDSLLALPGIGVAEAKLAIKHRESKGSFSSLDEFAAVLNLKPHKVERLRSHVTFSQVAARPPVIIIEPVPVVPDPAPLPTQVKPRAPGRVVDY